MRANAWLATLVLAGSLAGCSRGTSLNCEPTERYTAARSVQPIQIPDDLTPPAEEQALRLPPDAAANPRPQSQACLESPPSFYGDGRPTRTGRPPEAAPQPAAPAPAEDPERSIGN